MISYPEISLVGSEIALSLYPQLIKLVPSTLETQVAVRFLTYLILAGIGYFVYDYGKKENSKKDVVSKTGSWWYYIVMGIVNIFHILSSYISYKILPSGIAYSLFYTYPIFNLLSRSLFFGETFNIINYLYIAIAIAGVYFVYSNGHVESSNITKVNEENSGSSFINKFGTRDRLIGLAMGLGSAITESLIYLMVKADVSAVSPFIQIIKTYLVGGVVSAGYLAKYGNGIELDWNYWVTLILFNVIVGFIGYVVRFITIPRLGTLAFNSLIFVGVISAYVWGYLFSEEKIKIKNIIGTLMILGSVVKLNQ